MPKFIVVERNVDGSFYINEEFETMESAKDFVRKSIILGNEPESIAIYQFCGSGDYAKID
jgi:hypothetical protein